MNSQFPEGAIKRINGQCIVLRGNDIDTDRIIPARFLKCVSFEYLGEQVFADDRIELNGLHPFDQINNKGASILIVNDNFGCGSSREHAPQALMRWGIRGIIGEGFAEIFYGNCLSLGIPCATSSSEIINNLQKNIDAIPKAIWSLDMQSQCLQYSNQKYKLSIEAGPLEMLLNGRWDGTSQLISRQKEIKKVIKKLPYLNDFTNQL
tara:strand:- start:23638 stop:24258 length:621 start_codon:yes stop_codon:yes gene_type:complete